MSFKFFLSFVAPSWALEAQTEELGGGIGALLLPCVPPSAIGNVFQVFNHLNSNKLTNFCHYHFQFNSNQTTCTFLFSLQFQFHSFFPLNSESFICHFQFQFFNQTCTESLTSDQHNFFSESLISHKF